MLVDSYGDGLPGRGTLRPPFASFLRQSSFGCDSGLTPKPVGLESGMANDTECCP